MDISLVDKLFFCGFPKGFFYWLLKHVQKNGFNITVGHAMYFLHIFLAGGGCPSPRPRPP